MKKHLIFFTFIAVMSYAVPSVAIDITIAYENKEQYPYYMGNTDEIPLTKPGVSVEMIQLLEKHIPDLTVKLKRFPWKRCKSNLQKGSIDGIFNASFNKSRMELGTYPWKDGAVDPTRRITTIAYSFYKLNDSAFRWDGTKTHNLKGPVGAPLGYSIVKNLKKMGLVVDESPWTKNDFAKLLKGRVGAVAAQDATGDSLLKINPEQFQKIVKVTPPIKTKPYYLMLSKQFVKKHPKVAEKIWDTIKTLRESQFDQLLQSYAN